jgi:uncharacterized protein involved in type VI secretion and phage assembly
MPIAGIDRNKKYATFSIRYKGVETVMKPASLELKIDGKDVPQSVVESLVLDQALGDHTLLAIELRRRQELEDKFGSTLEANTRAWISKTLSLRITAADKSAGDPGDVSFIGTIVTATMGSVVGSLGNIYLRCFSPTVMLDINRMYRTWCDVSTSDIINGLVSSEGLPNAKVSVSGGTKLPGFLTYGQTPFQVINYLAGFEGWWAYYDGQNFNVTKELPESNIELKANQIGAFVVTLDAIGMKKFNGRAFEYEQGKWYQSKSPAPTASGHALGKAAAGANPISSSEEYLRLRHLPSSQGDLDKRLQSALRESYSRLLRGNGISDRLGISAGRILKIAWEGQRRQTESRREEELTGQYVITRATHKYEDGQYRCDFKCVDRTLAFPYYNNYEFPEHLYETAEVTDADDPEKLGRVKVRFGWSSAGGETETPFIRVRQSHAGDKSHGAWFIPEVGDGVLVSLRGPHLEQAVAVGSAYDGSRKPRTDLPDSKNNFKSLYTRSGHQITFSDEDSKEKITIATKDGGASIVLDAASGSEKLSLVAKNKDATVVLDGTKKVTIAAGGSSCQISFDGSGQSIKIEAGKSITLKANEINLEATAALNLKSSAQLVQKSGAKMDIDGGAMLTVKGGIVKIN